MAHTKKPETKASRVTELWETVERDFIDTLTIDLSYIDKLPDDDRIKDEFVRLPYDAPKRPEDCLW